MAKLDSYLARKAAAVQQRQADFRANPGAAVVTLTATSKVAGITGARPTRMGETVVISDSGPGLAGHALGPTAPEMLLGALASCLVHTYLLQAVLLNIPIDHVEVSTSGTLDYATVVGLPYDQPPRMQNLNYTAQVESWCIARTNRDAPHRRRDHMPGAEYPALSRRSQACCGRLSPVGIYISTIIPLEEPVSANPCVQNGMNHAALRGKSPVL